MRNKLLNDKLSQLYEKATKTFDLAIGYPVNRNHTFDVDLEYLGFKKDTFATCFLNNIGSPYTHGKYLSDNIKDLEVELIELFANHLGLDKNDSFGYVNSGGTEGNFAAIWWHREYFKKKFNQVPILISSNRSHYSVRKIANQLDLQLIQIDSDYAGIHVDDLEECLKHINTPVIFWNNFGATIGGSVDDAVIIKKLFEKYLPGKYKIHGDGAIYGLVIPYLEKFQHIKSIFDYIDSISISGHKFLGSYQMSGLVLSRRSYLEQVFMGEDRKVGILQNINDITVSGCRSGILTIELYLLLTEGFKINEDGVSNLQALWQDCLLRAQKFYKKFTRIVDKSNPYLWYNNYQINVIIPSPKEKTDRNFLANKYKLMPIGENSFGLYVFPKNSWEILEKFIDDCRLMEFKN